MRASLLLLLALLIPSIAAADTPIRFSGNLGLGIGLGPWTDGLSVKYFINESGSVEAVLGIWGLSGVASGFGLSADYLFEMPAIYNDPAFEVGWCFGLGPTIAGAGGYTDLGVHGTLGIELNLEKFPLDVALEYKPGLLLVPATLAQVADIELLARIYPF